MRRAQLLKVIGTPADHQWVIVWRTPSMAASAFWYYRTRAEGRKELRELKASWS